MKFKITILQGDRKRTEKCEIPDRFEDVTVEQWLAMENLVDKEDALAILGVFTGKKVKELFNAKRPKIEGKIFFQIKNLLESAPKDWKKLPIPRSVKIEKKEIEIPTDLGNEKWGKSILMRQVLEDQDMKFTDKILSILAIYLQEYYDGEFKHIRIDHVKELIKKEPALQFIPIASFFLTNYSLSYHIGKINSIKSMIQIPTVG